MTSIEHEQKPGIDANAPCRNKRITRIQTSENGITGHQQSYTTLKLHNSFCPERR